jgi:hypothetical protein
VGFTSEFGVCSQVFSIIFIVGVLGWVLFCLSFCVIILFLVWIRGR